MEILEKILLDIDGGKNINNIDYGVDKNKLGSILEDAKMQGYLENVNIIRTGMDNHVHTILCNGITNKGYNLIGK